MAVYEHLSIKQVIPERTTAPPPEFTEPNQSVGYDVALRLSRRATDAEARAMRDSFGEVVVHGPNGNGRVVLECDGDVLLVRNTTIEYVVEKLHQRLRAAVEAADEVSLRAAEKASSEAARVAAHQQHVRDVAAKLGW